MPQRMKAAFLVKAGVIELREIPIPEPKPGEVLVRIKAVGICGSDIKYFRHGRIGEYVVRKPLILGHEASGEIAALGQGVTRPAVGTPVSIEPGWPCGRCSFCRSGVYNLCPDILFMATPPDHGAFCEYVAVPADFAHPVPASLGIAEAAMMEPLAVAVHACRQAELRAGMNVLVSGGGTIGCCCIMAAKSMGADKIFLVEPDSFRRRISIGIGADAAFDPGHNSDMKNLFLELKGGADVVLETSGDSSAIGKSVETLRPGGCLVCVGFPLEERVPMDLTALISREGRINTVWRYANDYPYSIRIAAKGIAPVTKIITHRYNLEQLHEAMENAGKAGILKALVEM